VAGAESGSKPGNGDGVKQESGVSEAYISMIESGVRKNLSLPVLKRLVPALGVPVGSRWNSANE
jgi:transcriptional regulator with XRE-family HTH domain